MVNPIRVIADWARKTARQYGVNPVIFAVLYFGPIPPYGYAIYRFVVSLKRADWTQCGLWSAIVLFLFALPYTYVMIWGKNLPRRFWFLFFGWIAVMATSAIIRVIIQLR